jgi:hypothetical protein
MAGTKEALPTDGSIALEPTNIGYDYEVSVDPRRESIQKAAYTDWQIRQNPGEWLRLANGAAVRVQPGIMPGYETKPLEAEMLGHPGGEWFVENQRLLMKKESSMLVETKPPFFNKYGELVGPRYAWRVFNGLDPRDYRTAETKNLHRGNKIRYVETSEIDPHCSFAVHTEHPAGDTKYVTHMSMILVEILDPMLAYKMHKQYEDKAIQRAMNAPIDIAGSPSLGDGLITSVPGKFGTKLVVEADPPRR